MHKVKWYGVSVVLLLLSNTTPCGHVLAAVMVEVPVG
jgi:hypothetical protein